MTKIKYQYIIGTMLCATAFADINPVTALNPFSQESEYYNIKGGKIKIPSIGGDKIIEELEGPNLIGYLHSIFGVKSPENEWESKEPQETSTKELRAQRRQMIREKYGLKPAQARSEKRKGPNLIQGSKSFLDSAIKLREEMERQNEEVTKTTKIVVDITSNIAIEHVTEDEVTRNSLKVLRDKLLRLFS